MGAGGMPSDALHCHVGHVFTARLTVAPRSKWQRLSSIDQNIEKISRALCANEKAVWSFS
jgi:hypothetical protein